MPLESGDKIGDLVITNPPGTDLLSESDDHHRLIKRCLAGSFPNAGQEVLDSTFDEIDAIVQGGIKNNYAAIVDPTVDDDTGAGYAVGSMWINTVSGEKFTCVDASVGAAVWSKKGPVHVTAQYALTNSGSFAEAHGFGVLPSSGEVVLVNVTPEHGYIAGEEILWITGAGADHGGVQFAYDVTNITLVMVNTIANTNRLQIIPKGGGAYQYATSGNWQVKGKVWK